MRKNYEKETKKIRQGIALRLFGLLLVGWITIAAGSYLLYKVDWRAFAGVVVLFLGWKLTRSVQEVGKKLL